MRYRPPSLIPFFLLSLGAHLSFILLGPSLPEIGPKEESIPVTFVAPPERKDTKPPQKKATEPATKPSKAPAQIAKKSTPLPEEDTPPPKQTTAPEKPVVPEIPVREKETVARRRLPTMKELLPPVTWSPFEEQKQRRETPVHLDTTEPRYISYFTSIKRSIELVWDYPEPALRYGIEGKLVLEFTVLADGTLEGTRLIRSSGFSILDQEALRAVHAAAPFHPIPPWIGRTRLDIIASFEYHDNRVRYGLTP